MVEDPRRPIRDPIHGLIEREPDEIRVMNTSTFQRLRRIRQLAMAHLVYPSAMHTRFEHSLGTLHLAGRICTRLKDFGDIDDAGMRLIRLAALLHDVGHGPFSHVSEYLLDRHYDPTAVGQIGPTDSIHEKVTAHIILQDDEIASVLSDEDRRHIVGLLSDSRPRRFEHDILSGSLDVDKMDYLLRDGYFAGVKYGQFDLEKIIDVCRVYGSGDETYLAFDHEGIYALEQLVLAKYHMSQQVYFHRIRAITDAMLVRGLSMAVRDSVPPFDVLYRYDGSPDFVRRYLEYCDDSVLGLLSVCAHEKIRDVFSRLRARRIFKEICAFPVHDVADGIRRDRLSRLSPESEQTRALEAMIAEDMSLDPDYVVVTRQSIKNPTFRTPSHMLGEEEIIVLDDSGTPRPIADFPDLVFNLNKAAASRETIRVFAPRDHWRDPEDRRYEEREALRSRTQELILQAA